MTVAGTLTHEFGHYAVARALGYEASINYQSSSHWNDRINGYLNDIHRQYPEAIKNNGDFPGKEKYLRVMARYRSDSFWIILGGPLQTMLTGTIGFILLLSYRKKIMTTVRVRFAGWLIIFMALFWLRQVANLFVGIASVLVKGQTTIRGDEMSLAYLSGINIWSIQILTGLLGIGVLIQVIRMLPNNKVLTFLISGLVGGSVGYYLWLVQFGPYILP